MILNYVAMPILSVLVMAQNGVAETDDFKRGREALEKGDFDQAIASFSDVIRDDPKNAFAYSVRGFAYQRKQNYGRAINDYTEAIRLDPKLIHAFNNRGLAYQEKNDYERAIADFTEVIRLNPKFAVAFYNRGVAYQDKKDLDRAIADFSEAIRLNPKIANAFYNRGLGYGEKRDFSRAAADYAEAIRLDSKDADACYKLAHLLATCPKAEIRDGKKAIEYATRACELTSWKNLLFVDILAAAYAEAGQFDEAVKWQQKALGNPEYPKDERSVALKRLELYKTGKRLRDD